MRGKNRSDRSQTTQSHLELSTVDILTNVQQISLFAQVLNWLTLPLPRMLPSNPGDLLPYKSLGDKVYRNGG
ncbi:hypothetical protein J6590_028308 [Homalodisca vitripennis]|nr:hypothetical protein J6590_028308 [Homalodisca vitripennis]